jgi:hypothetical protein
MFLLLSGAMPSDIPHPSRIVSIAHDGAVGLCGITPPNHWICPSAERPDAPALILIVGDSRVGYLVPDPRHTGPVRTRAWGRVIELNAQGVSQRPLEVGARLWRPDRSMLRPRLARFGRIEDTSLEFIRLTGTLAFVAADSDDPDAFVEFSGPAIASTRVPVADLRQGLLEAATTVWLAAPLDLDGRVRTASSEDVPRANVELFEPLVLDRAALRPHQTPPMILRATTESGADGTFSFGHLELGRYQVVATAPDGSRGTAEVRSPTDPAFVTVVEPPRAIGRVLRNHVPEAGARVRFVPSAEAVAGSTDPADLGLTEVTTDPDGTFSLPLPRDALGTIQAIAVDGVSVRTALAAEPHSRTIIVHDLALLEPHRVVVRVVDQVSCETTMIGPLAELGLSVVRGMDAGGGIATFDLPEAGEWALDVTCSDRSYSVVPGTIMVPQARPDVPIDVRLR